MKIQRLISVILVIKGLGNIGMAQTQNEFVKNQVKVIAEIPVQFGVGCELKYSRHFSSNFQLGILTQPNSTIILSTLQTLGTSEDVVLMLQDAFKFGVVYKGTLNYSFRKNYVGVFIQLINLSGKDTPVSLVETAMGVSLAGYPKYPGKTNATSTVLTLNSTLVQGGILYGRRFPIKKRSEIDLEFGISANIGSSSSLHSDERNLTALNDYANTYFAGIYKSYALVPSITIAYGIKIGR